MVKLAKSELITHFRDSISEQEDLPSQYRRTLKRFRIRPTEVQQGQEKSSAPRAE